MVGATRQPLELVRSSESRGSDSRGTVRAPSHEPQRQTVKAPAGDRDGEVPTEIPSRRPTSVPDMDLLTDPLLSLRVDSQSSFPPSIAVPVRVNSAGLEAIDLRTAFLLMHVDGVSTVSQIAQMTQMPMQEAIQCFLHLLSRGIVELTGMSQSNRVPSSGVQSRADDIQVDVDEDDFF